MPQKKPVAKRKAPAPKRQSRKSADADRDAKHARKRVKQRLLALEGQVATIQSTLDDWMEIRAKIITESN